MKAILIYWQGLEKREQHFAMITIVVLILCLLYFGIISPLQKRAEQAQKNVRSELGVFVWVSDKAGEIEAFRGQAGDTTQVSALPLNQAVTSSVKHYNLEIDRLQPFQEDIEVWLKPMPFSSLLKWLEDLSKKYGVQVKFIDIGKTDAQGMVEVKRLRLGRG